MSLDSPVLIDGIPIDSLATALAAVGNTAKTGPDTFWASISRSVGDPHTEVLEIQLGSAQPVNRLDFEVSRFPLVLMAEYHDGDGWHAFEYSLQDPADKTITPQRDLISQPLMLTFSESVPAQAVNRPTDTGHPLHYGTDHWHVESWHTIPVTADSVRFLIKRNPFGTPPRGITGYPTDYSVAMRNVKVGYEVTSAADLPRNSDILGTSNDILGSTVVYGLYQQSAAKAIDGDPGTSWSCEPQPINYSVVNLMVDMRDANGDGQVIDSFYVDPTTPGVSLHLYYSNADPEGEYLGSSQPVPYIFRSEIGSPGSYTSSGATIPDYLTYGPDQRTGVALAAGYGLLRLDQDWWVGLDCIELDTEMSQERPLLSLGGNYLYRDDTGTNLIFELQSGDQATIPLDPAVHVPGQRFRVIVGYVRNDGVNDPHVVLVYQAQGFPAQVAGVATTEFTDDAVSIRVGMHPDPADTKISSMGLYGLVLKTETLSDDSQDWFLAEGEQYVRDAPWAQVDRHSQANALVRLHPTWATEENVFGIVGGSDERLSTGVSWTPVHRDFTLRKGFLHFPPTKAKYWKFEFTNLAPVIYETHQVLSRVVSLFPTSVVDSYNQVASAPVNDFSQAGPSVTGDASAYSDALSLLRTQSQGSVGPEAVRTLTVKNPQQAAQVANAGWIWQYQPWHTGVASPRFASPGTHRYELLPVRHPTKVAYFVGVKEVTPYRTDFRVEDDTSEYVEHFLDDTFVDTSESLVITDDGIITNSSYATFTSQKMESFKYVRAVQFATVQTGMVEVLPDPTFVDPDLSDFYAPYGDAHPLRIEEGLVEIRRGWIAQTYGDLETLTYGDLEAWTYGRMEGNISPSGSAEGGIQTTPYSPQGESLMVGSAVISSDSLLTQPVLVEIVSGDGDVLSSEQVYLKPGVLTTVETEYGAGEVVAFHTYDDVENFPDISDPDTPTLATYGTLDEYTYANLEADTTVNPQVYVRVRQPGGTQDTFRIHKIGLYVDPIVWSFSVDDGATWWPAVGVRNDPDGVLIFPTVGSELRWRAEVFRPETTISAVHVRPWYGSRSATAAPAHDLSALGPVQSVYDEFPALPDHPIWKERDTRVEQVYVLPTAAPEVWRNLAPNPGNETTDAEFIVVSGGTVETGYDWEVGS